MQKAVTTPITMPAMEPDGNLGCISVSAGDAVPVGAGVVAIGREVGAFRPDVVRSDCCQPMINPRWSMVPFSSIFIETEVARGLA